MIEIEKMYEDFNITDEIKENFKSFQIEEEGSCEYEVVTTCHTEYQAEEER